MGRRGVSVEAAKAAVRRSNTAIAALMVTLGDADAMLCGLVGPIRQPPGPCPRRDRYQAGGDRLATLNALMLEKRTLFIADTLSTKTRTPSNWRTSR
jgi:malate dehydrogenase (oxaloacetate-decarboxylating)(NADP+)